jgi:hypothetical protein
LEAAYWKRIFAEEMRAESPETARAPGFVAQLAHSSLLGGYATVLQAVYLVLVRLSRGKMALPPLAPAEAADAQAYVLDAIALRCAVLQAHV